MNPLPFPVGQKVICINGTFAETVFEDFRRVPEEGKVYTIHEVLWGFDLLNRETALGVRLTEFPPIVPGWGGFCLWRFRLLEDEKILRQRQRKAQVTQPKTAPQHEPLVLA